MRKIYLSLGFVFLFLNVSQSYAEENSPIVQIVSYEEIYGKYFQMMGWGSASLIGKDGTIITNNHVVDNQKGGVFDYFNICLSFSENSKPLCNYTAHIVKRDQEKDLALLKINPLDIYGDKVTFSQFKNVEIDYEYIPKSGDRLEAIGFPWVGSETITKTEGIVSGTSQYNNATYIKTDALIAGGNSGGAFLKGNTLVAIPTFGIGGLSDASLGYGLLIRDAKSFILEVPEISPIVKDNLRFNNYKKQLDQINTTMNISDSFLKINFGKEYSVSDYTIGKGARFEPTQQNSLLPQSITISLSDFPDTKNQNDFLYILQNLGFYNQDYQKLKKIKIGGIEFFQPIAINDITSGETSEITSYFALEKGYLIILDVELGYNVEENTIQKVNAELISFLNKITFSKESIASINFDLKFKDPYFTLQDNKNIIYFDNLGIANIYPFGNLHEYIAIQLIEQDIYTGKGKNVDEIYSLETKEVPENMKSKISFMGHPGFVVCLDSPEIYRNISTDQKGNYLDQSHCYIKIFSIQGGEESYIAIFDLITDKKNIKTGLAGLIRVLPKIVSLDTIGAGETRLVDIFKTQDNFSYSDLKDQSEVYKDKLNLLIKYGILKKSLKFEPYKPITRGEYIDMQLSYVYKVDLDSVSCKDADTRCRLKSYRVTIDSETKSIAYFLDLIGIKIDFYMDSSNMYSLNTILDLLLFAGVNPRNLTEEWLEKYSAKKDEKEFKTITKKIQDAYFELYGTRKILLFEVLGQNYNDFWSNTSLYYSSLENKIIEFPYYSPGTLNLTKKYKDIYAADNELYYPVITRARAIDEISNLIDFGLFDPELAKKKETIIE